MRYAPTHIARNQIPVPVPGAPRCCGVCCNSRNTKQWMCTAWYSDFMMVRAHVGKHHCTKSVNCLYQNIAMHGSTLIADFVRTGLMTH